MTITANCSVSIIRIGNQITDAPCPVHWASIDLRMNCEPDTYSGATAVPLNNWYARQWRIQA